MEYLHWNEQTITDFSPENIAAQYERGFVFTRKGKGIMHQTRSCRIDLSKFEMSSENRRILKKVDGVTLSVQPLPLKDYDYTLGKFAKDFYDAKFGPGVMSAQKIKEMLTDPVRSNFNAIYRYSVRNASQDQERTLGVSICYTCNSFLHYSYPFYDLTLSPKDMGLGMMTMAIKIAKMIGCPYIYLGSLQRPSDTYKFQFAGFEWFDGGPNGTNTWRTDTDSLKNILK
jgi:arginyl-tRNA--protein-N-Asp/Glu arginylyltransferase